MLRQHIRIVRVDDCVFRRLCEEILGVPEQILIHRIVPRQQDGKTEVLDGPYADIKEQLAGYFMIDVPDLDQAIAWAKRCPSSKYGSIEIRPLAQNYPRPDLKLRQQGS